MLHQEELNLGGYIISRRQGLEGKADRELERISKKTDLDMDRIRPIAEKAYNDYIKCVNDGSGLSKALYKIPITHLVAIYNI